jgi:CHAT domain-containing protein
MADPAGRPDSTPEDPADPITRRLRSARFGGAFTPLPGSASEIERIQKYFPAGTAKVLSGPNATETSYNTLSPDAGIVHFATHAIAVDDHPFYSTLILAPDREAREDGFLQAFEILRHPLRASLVVLSACETAGGPASRGEGLVGLVAAFQQAGARLVLATQWGIDESAADLMAAFYKGITAGRAVPEALRDAKLEILKKSLHLGGVDISLAHPFFWAPFVLIGNPD